MLDCNNRQVIVFAQYYTLCCTKLMYTHVRLYLTAEYGIVVQLHTRASQYIYGELSGKIFDTDVTAVTVTNIHWHLPCLGSVVAVTLSHSLGADLLGCHSQYER